MKRLYNVLISVFVLCLLIITTACMGGHPPFEKRPEGQAMVLKSYDLSLKDAAHALEVKNVLQEILGDDEVDKEVLKLGTAQITPDGQLLVAAPAEFHAGIEEFLKKMAQSKPMAPPPSIKVKYWVVLGQNTDNPENIKTHSEISEVLKELNKSVGPQNFTVLESLMTTAVSGKQARIHGNLAYVKNKATEYHGKIIMKLEINVGKPSLKTRVQIPTGKTLVLGQSSTKDEKLLKEISSESVEKKDSVNIYYIVKAETL